MEVLGVNHMSSRKQTKRVKKPVKVVYIDTPVKVKTCASKFRDLVQELTGRDSDLARYAEANGVQDDTRGFPDQQSRRTLDDEASKFHLSKLLPYSDSPFSPFPGYVPLDALANFHPI